MLGVGARWLGERRIEEHAADACDVAQDAVEHTTSLFVAVEAFGDVIAQVAAGLGEADGQRMCHGPARGRRRLGRVAQPAEIAEWVWILTGSGTAGFVDGETIVISGADVMR